MLTTTILACRCPKLIAPAMNTNMYENPVTQDNLALLRVMAGKSSNLPADVLPAAPWQGQAAGAGGNSAIYPASAGLPSRSCREKGACHAGPTQEAIDPVRYLTNHSTGKMGYAIARMAMLRGADVTLVSGPTAIAPPPFVTRSPRRFRSGYV